MNYRSDWFMILYMWHRLDAVVLCESNTECIPWYFDQPVTGYRGEGSIFNGPNVYCTSYPVYESLVMTWSTVGVIIL